MSTHSRGQCGHAVVARVPGRPGIGGRTNRAARVSSARTIGHTCKHANTRARTHTHTRRHSLRPRRSLRRLSSLSLPFVLVTAIRPGHCHSSWSPPFVHVTAIRPSCVAHTAVCSVAMLPCLLFVDACSTDDPVPAPPTWPSAWNCTCTAPMTDGLKLPGCALRCHIRRRGRTCVHAQRCGRTCFLRQVNQQEGKKR